MGSHGVMSTTVSPDAVFIISHRPGHHPAHDVVERRQVAHRRLHSLLNASVDRTHQPPRPLLLQGRPPTAAPASCRLRDADAELRPARSTGSPCPRTPAAHSTCSSETPPPAARTHRLLERLQSVQPVVPLHAVPQRKSLLLLTPHRANDLVRVIDVRWHMSSPSSHIRAATPKRRSPHNSNIERAFPCVKSAHGTQNLDIPPCYNGLQASLCKTGLASAFEPSEKRPECPDRRVGAPAVPPPTSAASTGKTTGW